MADATNTTQLSRCFACGFKAPTGGDEWTSVIHPPLGTLTQCPECGSTDVRSPG